MSKLTIQQWNKDDMPREKFIHNGPESLSNAELLALLLRSGSKGENAVDLARSILEHADNKISNLKRFTINDLRRFNGIGHTKAISILTTFELLRRAEIELATGDRSPKIYSSKNAAALVQPILKDLPHEECWILYLNRANVLIDKERLSSGGINSTVMDIKIILKKAIYNLCSSIILVHNHPSGNKNPGEQDKIQTERLKNAAATIDIELIDHIIIAGDSYYSFLDEGIL